MYGYTPGNNPGIARPGVDSAIVLFVRYGSGFSLVLGTGLG